MLMQAERWGRQGNNTHVFILKKMSPLVARRVFLLQVTVTCLMEDDITHVAPLGFAT